MAMTGNLPSEKSSTGISIFENRVPIPRDFPELMVTLFLDKNTLTRRMQEFGFDSSTCIEVVFPKRIKAESNPIGQECVDGLEERGFRARICEDVFIFGPKRTYVETFAAGKLTNPIGVIVNNSFIEDESRRAIFLADSMYDVGGTLA